MKLVSVIIPTYNAEKFIAATLQSVIDQTYKNLEVIVVDDASPDQSVEICRQFTDPRIKIVSQKNRGLAGARNTGIRHAQGEYLAFLDADDLWLPEKLEKHIAHLERFPTVGASFSHSAFIDEAGNALGLYQMSKLQDITPLDLFCRTPIGNGSAAVFRREVFEAIKFPDNLYGTVEDFYFDDRFRESEDVECWLRIAIQTDWQIEGIPEALTLYRVNSSGLSANLTKKLKSWEKLIEKTRSYAPEVMQECEKPAMAYQLRYLARRAVTLKDGAVAVKLFHQALSTYWRILIEEPRRTLLTGAAAYLLWLLPQSLYHKMEEFALKMTGANQKRRILREQSGQAT
jgi:glycosyltransferase involved in cell wall biosynthesis